MLLYKGHIFNSEVYESNETYYKISSYKINLLENKSQGGNLTKPSFTTEITEKKQDINKLKSELLLFGINFY